MLSSHIWIWLKTFRLYSFGAWIFHVKKKKSTGADVPLLALSSCTDAVSISVPSADWICLILLNVHEINSLRRSFQAGFERSLKLFIGLNFEVFFHLTATDLSLLCNLLYSCTLVSYPSCLKSWEPYQLSPLSLYPLPLLNKLLRVVKVSVCILYVCVMNQASRFFICSHTDFVCLDYCVHCQSVQILRW